MTPRRFNWIGLAALITALTLFAGAVWVVGYSGS